MQDDLASGDEILTAGGIYGTVRGDRGRGRPARDRAGHDRPPRPARRCGGRAGETEPEPEEVEAEPEDSPSPGES